MSDAQPPPQLRLKPRLKTEGESAPAAAAPTPAPGEVASASSTPATPPPPQTPPPIGAIRLRPRPPTADSPAPAVPPPITPVAPATPETPASAPAAVVPASSSEQAQAADAALRFKLKPKTSEAGSPTPPAEPAPSVSAVPEAGAAPAPSAAIAPPEGVPVPTPQQEPPIGGAPRGLKLSPKTPPTLHPHPEGVPPAFIIETPPPPGPPPVEVAVPAPNAGPGIPASSGVPAIPGQPGEPAVPALPSPALASAGTRPPGFPPPVALNKPKVPHFKPAAKLDMAKVSGEKAGPEKKALKFGVLAVLGLAFALLLGGGYFLYAYFTAEPDAPPPLATKPASPATPDATAPAPKAAPATAQTPAPAVPATQPASTPPPAAPEAAPPAQPQPASPLATDTPQSMPGKMVQKAQDSLAARRHLEQDRTDAILEGREGGDQRGFPFNKEQPSAQPAKNTTVSNIAPGVAATDDKIKTASPKTSASFKRVVSELVIRGVFQGKPARAHINGRIVIAGNPVDHDEGIIFVGVNPADKTITFRDASGATISRKY